jgi:UDPglucose 6-dehydrogenase
MNELSNIAELTGADIESVRIGIGSDPRIGYHFIYPGAGYGGSCFPKDVQALGKTAREYGYTAELLESVEAVNYRQKEVIFKKIMTHYDNDIKGKKFALWGLSFKPNTDDMREAPSRVLLESLWKAGATVNAYDPQAVHETQRIYGDHNGLTLCDNKEEALTSVDALIIITEWNVFRSPDFEEIKKNLKEPVIFDGRNIYDPKVMQEMGFRYYSIGRAIV